MIFFNVEWSCTVNFAPKHDMLFNTIGHVYRQSLFIPREHKPIVAPNFSYDGIAWQHLIKKALEASARIRDINLSLMTHTTFRSVWSTVRMQILLPCQKFAGRLFPISWKNTHPQINFIKSLYTPYTYRYICEPVGRSNGKHLKLVTINKKQKIIDLYCITFWKIFYLWFEKCIDKATNRRRCWYVRNYENDDHT